MSERYKALIIGAGKIAGGYNAGPGDEMVLTHALAYLRHPKFDLVACVEPDEAARAAFMKNWGIPKGYASLDAALRDGGFDTASVCSPTGTHLAALEKLLASDVARVFAEKPLDGDAPAARKLASAFANKKVPVAVNYTRRFDPSMKALKEEIASGKYGELCSVAGWYDGGVMNNGSHLFDLANYLTGRVAGLLTAVPGSAAESDPPISALAMLGEAPFHIVARRSGIGSRFELEIALSGAIVTIEDGGFALRIRRYESSGAFAGEKVLQRGDWKPTAFGSAMLSALDELAAWPHTGTLSSDMNSASHAIELAGTMRKRASER